MKGITAIRFRSHENLLVLQVSEYENSDYGYNRSIEKWRDATVEDMLEVAPFMPDLTLLSTRLNGLSQQIEAMRYEQRGSNEHTLST